MRGFFKLIAAGAAMLTLSACNMFPVGPDLAKAPTPFGNATQIGLVNEAESLDVEIRHLPDGDRVTLTYPLLGQKPYEGDVTYHAVEASGDDANWLLAANVFQSADRSVYALLRYPKTATFTPGSETQAEIMLMTCVMRMPSEEEMKAKYGDSEAASEEEQSALLAGAMVEIMGACDFNTVDEVHAFAPKMIAAAKLEVETNATKTTDEERENNYEWKPVVIKVK